MCIFYNKSLISSECKYADSLSYDDMKQILMKEGTCFKCLAANVSQFCKRKIQISGCIKFHYKVMCPEKNDLKHQIKSHQFENFKVKK